MSPSIAVHKGTTARATVTASASPSPAPSTRTATPLSADPWATGDLDRGSVMHQLPVGDHELMVHYWTDESTVSAVHVSAALRGADRQHAVKVTRFAAAIDTTQLADDRGEFVLTPPYSYTTALAVPAVLPMQDGDAAVTRTLSVHFDLLVETAPGSGSFFRQTVIDRVVLSRGVQGVIQ